MSYYGIGPCAAIGIIKSAIKEAILEGKIENTFEEASNEMIAQANQLGLVPVSSK
jgi:poly(A) polymerase